MALSRESCFDRFVADLATVVGALVGEPAAAGPAGEAPEGGWVVTLQAEQAVRGVLLVHFDRTGADALAKRVMGMEVEPPAEVVIDTLKEMCGQAAGSMVQEPPFVGGRFTITSVEPARDQPAPGHCLMQIAVGDLVTLRMRVWGDLVVSAEKDRTDPAPATASAAPAAQGGPRLDAILDIDLPLLVRFGRTEMALRALTALGPGSVIDLGRSPDDPVEVLVSGQVIARGEVVIVGGNYGVRITDVMSPSERIRSMEMDS
jgi:flagellar motor switch protein FliN/FliY